MLSDLYIRLRSLFRRSKVEEELDDELHLHQEQQIDKYMRSGMSRDTAQCPRCLAARRLEHRPKALCDLFNFLSRRDEKEHTQAPP
jgi:hypothetical protein